MKNSFLKKLIAGTVLCTALCAALPQPASAAWIQDYSGTWRYTEGYGYATGWRLINGTWYYFDGYGRMQTGWIYTNGTWYYTDASGAMQTGVIQVNNKIYVLASNGAMQTGNIIIGGKLISLDFNGAVVGENIPTPQASFDWLGRRTHAFLPEQIIDTNVVENYDDDEENDYKKTFKVRFKDSDGDEFKTKTVEDGEKLELYEPTKKGYEFIEWNTRKSGTGTGYDAKSKVRITEDLTLYAQWKEKEEEEEIKVSLITISGENNMNSITTSGGTLQLTAHVSPSSAANKNVTWSVTNITGRASINASGKLTAIANGTVKVSAVAKDGSRVGATMTVTISGQNS